MKPLVRFVTGLASLGVLLGAGACSIPYCDTSTYTQGAGACQPEGLQLAVAVDQKRIDLRSPMPLPIRVEASGKDSHDPLRLAAVPAVKLTLDGELLTDPRSAMGSDKRSLVLSRAPEQLKVGPLQVEVTLPGLPPAQSDGLNRVFIAPGLPKLELAETVLPGAAGMMNPHRTGLVTGRVWVQIASPVGQPGQVLITEQIEAGGMSRRWLDLYQQGSNQSLAYTNSAEWELTQMNLFEGPDARLALIPGAVVIYDYYMGTGRKDLTLLPLKGSRQSGLSMVVTQVPSDATALAASSEESAILLARPNEVRAFWVDPDPTHIPIKHLRTITVSGAAIIAARDAMGAAPIQRSSDSFAVIWEQMSGQGTLLKLTRSMGVATDVERVPIGDTVKAPGLTAAALADLDSDGLQDLIVAQADGALAWSPQQPDGTFKELAALGISIPKVSAISVGDINQDKLPDLAVATEDQRVLIFRNQP